MMEIQSQFMRLLKERPTFNEMRRRVIDMFATFLDYSEVLASKLVEGTGLRYDVDGYHSTVPGQEVYSGQAGFLSRAQDGAECVVWNAGGESIVIATKDRRFEVALEAGEVVMHNMPSDPTKQSTIRITDAGDVEVTMHASAKMSVTRGGTPEAVATKSDVQALWELLTGTAGEPPWAPAGTLLDAKALQDLAKTQYTAAQTAGIGSPALEADD